jgi:hypothetical protein
VQTHGGKNWDAIAVLVMGRTRKQCQQKWRNVLRANIEAKGPWTENEDVKLKDAIQTYGGKNWVQLPRWFRVDRKVSVGIDGMVPWSPTSGTYG